MVVINIHGSAYKIDFYCNPYPDNTNPTQQCPKKRRTQTT